VDRGVEKVGNGPKVESKLGVKAKPRRCLERHVFREGVFEKRKRKNQGLRVVPFGAQGSGKKITGKAPGMSGGGGGGVKNKERGKGWGFSQNKI